MGGAMSGPDERGDTHAPTVSGAGPASPPESPTAEQAEYPDICEEWSPPVKPRSIA